MLLAIWELHILTWYSRCLWAWWSLQVKIRSSWWFSQTHNPYQRHEPTFTKEEPRTRQQPQFLYYLVQNLDKTISQRDPHLPFITWSAACRGVGLQGPSSPGQRGTWKFFPPRHKGSWGSPASSLSIQVTEVRANGSEKLKVGIGKSCNFAC